MHPGLDAQVAAGALLAVADGLLGRRISDPGRDRAALRPMVEALLGRGR